MMKYVHIYGVVATFLWASAGIQAQNQADSIFLLNGEEIIAEVEQVEGKYILYTPYEEEGRPAHRVAKANLDRVKMANGTELWFNRLPQEARVEEEAAAPKADKKRKKKRAVSSQKLQRQR